MDNTPTKTKAPGAKKAEKQSRTKAVISAADVVAKIRASRPASLQGLEDNAAVRLAREVLNEVGTQLNATAEGAVQVTGLGIFAISQRSKEGEAQPGTPAKSKKRIVFKTKAKEPGDKAAKKEKKAARKEKGAA